jgi:hypothetical protein
MLDREQILVTGNQVPSLPDQGRFDEWQIPRIPAERQFCQAVAPISWPIASWS